MSGFLLEGFRFCATVLADRSLFADRSFMRCRVTRSRRTPLQLAPSVPRRVRRRLSPEGGKAIEVLGHAIEYLADEYAADTTSKGVLASADPRIEAIEVLKALNRAVYFSGTEVQPVFRRVRQWFLGVRAPGLGESR